MSSAGVSGLKVAAAAAVCVFVLVLVVVGMGQPVLAADETSCAVCKLDLECDLICGDAAYSECGCGNNPDPEACDVKCTGEKLASCLEFCEAGCRPPSCSDQPPAVSAV
ncbi:hypothetical protein ACP70R_021142 [Stipagrostis hirtigluma subsp. patula]